MKKVLSFVLVLAMVLGSVSMVFAFSDVESGADHEEAINVLSSLGVVSGYTDGTFKPENVVTRAEMAAFLINALFGEDKQITQRATKFSDVTAAHWASGFVDYANTLDIIAGYTDGTFKPDQTVTYNEAITMVVKALGYRDAALNGTYPASYVNQAKALGLLEDVDGLGTTGAARGDIAQLVYNALNCPIGTVNKDGEWVANKTKNGNDTMLARLGGYQDDTAIVIDEDDIEEAIVDISKYLGAYAKVVRTKAGGPIVGVYSLESESYTEEVNSTAKKIGDYTFKSTVDWAKTVYFVNGVTTSGAAIADYAKEEVTVWGEFSGKYATEIYSVLSWDVTKAAQAGSKVQEDIEDGELLGCDFELDDNDAIVEGSFILNGVDSLEDIKEDDVVFVYVGDGKITRVDVGTEVVTGTITKINTSNSKPTVNGTVYGFSAELTAAEKDAVINDFAFKTEFNFYLDYEGNIYAIEEVKADTETAYGVILDAGLAGATWASATGDRFVKLFTEEGKTTSFSVDEDTADENSDLLKVATTAEAWKTALYAKKGAVVEYELDEDGVLVGLEEVTWTGADTDKDINKKGAYVGYYFAGDAIIFVYDSADDEYSMLAAEKAVNMEKVDASYAVNSKGKINLMLITDSAAATADPVYGILTGSAKIGTSDYELDFVVDGEKVTYEGGKVTLTNVLVEVEFDGEDVKAVHKVVDGYTSLADSKVVAVETVSITTSAAITKNSFVPDGNKTAALALDASAVVYLLDDGKYDDLGDVDDLEDLTSTDTAYFYDIDEDGVYEIVVIDFK